MSRKQPTVDEDCCELCGDEIMAEDETKKVSATMAHKMDIPAGAIVHLDCYDKNVPVYKKPTRYSRWSDK